MLFKFLIGKLNEGNRMLDRAFYRSQLSRQYDPVLAPEVSEALNKLRKYFGRANLINKIRNAFAFHYTPDDIASAIHNVDEHELMLYIEEAVSANNLFYGAEALANKALMALVREFIDEDDHEKLEDKFVQEVIEVADQFSFACDSLMYEILKKYVPGVWRGYAPEVDFGELPAFLDIRIPWFTDTSDLP